MILRLPPHSLVPRHAHRLVTEALADTPIVVIQGARQVGKSTLAGQVLAGRPSRLVTLDDPGTLAAAEADPVTFVNQYPNGCLGVDEVQRAPGLVLALKAAVDANRRPGRFLLTGSANLLRLPANHDSLAGRSESVELFGLSQGELAGRQEGFIDRLLAGDLMVDAADGPSRAEYMNRICAGGYPEVLRRDPGRRRNAWLDNYLERIIQRDAADVSGLQRLAEIPALLRLLAARNTAELNRRALANDIGIPERTLPPYLQLLETLYLVHYLPAWSNNLSKRVVGRPKAALLDTGLAARLVNVSADALTAEVTPERAGPLTEAFVLAEVRKQLGWSDQQPRLYHYRDHDGPEIDLIVETGDGRVAAIEVKAAATLNNRDFRWLTQLRDRLGRRFTAGVTLYAGASPLPWGDRLAALPIAALWTT